MTWMREGSLDLDFSPESLKLLDRRMHKMYQELDPEERKKRALLLWGCYLGEVTRRELAGGQWQFSTESLMGSTIVVPYGRHL